jgi:hypothetical protein
MFRLKIDGKKIEIAFLSGPNLKIVGAIESLGLRQQSQMIWSAEGVEDRILDKLKNFCVRFSSVGAEIIEVDAVEVVDTQVDTPQPELLSGKNEIEDLRREVADLKKLLGVCSQKLSDLKATPKTKKSRRSKASLRN